MFRVTLFVAFVSAVAMVSAQAPAPAFDVASVRPNTSGSYSSSTETLPSGAFRVVNAHVKAMIAYGYDLRPLQILGGPGWIESDRFDVAAKAPEGEWDGPLIQAMLRTLLADRFKLTAHTETQEQAVYTLVWARRDGAPGPQLKRSTRDCSTVQARPCGVHMTSDARGTTMQATAVSLVDLAGTLGGIVERAVIDRTGAVGAFDMDLRFTRDGAAGGVAGDTPSIFGALQEQLALKLEPARAPVQVLVIDSVERPTPD